MHLDHVFLWRLAVVVDPLPMATKVYCLRTQQRMRAVLGSLFRDACNRPAVSNGGNSPDRLSGEMGGQVSAVPITSDLSSDLQKAQLLGFNQKKVNFFAYTCRCNSY